MTFKDYILEYMEYYSESGDDIEAVKFTGWGWSRDHKDEYQDEPQMIPPEDFVDGSCGLGFDEDHDVGFGGDTTPGFIIWTDENVYVKHEYDGSVSIRRVPRSPEAV